MVEKYESKNSATPQNASVINQMERDYSNLEFFSNSIKVKERTLEHNLAALTKSNAIIEFDLNGKILNVNELFLDLLGYNEDEVIGKHHSIFLDHSATNLDEYEAFWRNLRNGKFQQDEFRRMRKDGNAVWLRGNYNPILNADGVPETVLKIATDITLNKKQQIEIDAITTAIYKSNLTIEFDLEGRILKANDSFLQTMEYSLDEVQGKHHSIFLEQGTKDHPEYVSFWENLRRGEYESGEYMRLTKNGKIVWIKGNYNPIFNTQGKPYKVIKIATDITQTKQQQFELTEVNNKLQSHSENLKLQHQKLQQINNELKQKSEALEQKNKEVEAALLLVDQKTTQLQISNRYKSEFLANMSHELRTPLNSLLILSQDLAENKAKNLTQEQVESSEIIYRSGTDLLELINEVLDLSKIEAGKMTLNVFKISLDVVVKDIYADFKHQADKKQLEFQISVDANVPSHIVTDRQRLNQVLRNIISNAIKFTTSGGVTVKISSSDKKILFKIADSGIGISLSEQSSVFEPFHQADSGTARKFGGTGLGLSISRDLVKLLDGELSLESKLNQGSTFTISIPHIITNDFAASHEIDPLQDEKTSLQELSTTKNKAAQPLFQSDDIVTSKAEVQALVGKTIVVVDDDMRNMFALSKILRAKGMNIIKCESGKSAINVINSHSNIDLLLMDIMMPEMNGYETIAKIRNCPNGISVPIIALTAKAMKEDERKCMDAGANGYLTKPLNIPNLLQMMCETIQ